jgi:hypothetical protein
MKTILIRFGALAACACFAACGKTLFQSDFDQTPASQPPAQTQKVGSLELIGPASTVFVVPSPAGPGGQWVAIRRPTNETSPVAGFQGRLAEFGGEGEHQFSAVLFIPSGTGALSIQFERFNQPLVDLSTFLHLDFMPEGNVRVDDRPDMTFGSFPHGQPFVLQVNWKITSGAASAHIVLGGADASGEFDRTVPPPFVIQARQFGAFRFSMGFGSTGIADATNIVVKRKGG